MGYRDIRIIIVTQNLVFFNGIRDELLDASFTESVTNVKNLCETKGLFHKYKINVLIADLDNSILTVNYLKQIMEKNKVLILTTAASQNTAMPYMKAGIKEFILMPRIYNSFYFSMFTNAAKVKIKLYEDSSPALNYMGMQRTVDINQKIVVMASSTGGTEALEKIFRELPANIPPILVVQHMPSGFTKLFATRLNSLCQMEIKEATNNDYVQKGTVLIAPADHHMKLVRRNSKLMVECFAGVKVHGVMPAADILFESVAPIMRANAIGVILTGMGADGAKGLYMMRLNGARTVGQDKESCVVYGMPKVAFDLGALEKQVPIDKMAATIMSLV